MASAAERERQRLDMAKDEHRSLAECAQECSQDITAISKQILEFILDRVRRGSNDRLVELLILFEQKLERMKKLVQLSPEYREREELIAQLEKCVENRDEILQSYSNNLRGAEQLLTKGIFQASKKLRTMAESDANPVYSEDVIKFSHQISKSYSVAAPAYWQQGDPSRPFPTEHELRQSSIDSVKNTVPMLTSILSMTARPSSSQLVSSRPPAASPSLNYAASPRTAASATTQSPRGKPNAAGGAGVTPSGSTLSVTAQWKGQEVSPFPSTKPKTSPKRSALNQAGKLPDQMMSSDSSSSSSSGEEN